MPKASDDSEYTGPRTESCLGPQSLPLRNSSWGTVDTEAPLALGSSGCQDPCLPSSPLLGLEHRAMAEHNKACGGLGSTPYIPPLPPGGAGPGDW